MFSKTVLSSAIFGTLVSSVAAGPIERAIAEVAAAAPRIVFSPSRPVGNGENFAGDRDLSLTRGDNFYWTHDEQG